MLRNGCIAWSYDFGVRTDVFQNFKLLIFPYYLTLFMYECLDIPGLAACIFIQQTQSVCWTNQLIWFSFVSVTKAHCTRGACSIMPSHSLKNCFVLFSDIMWISAYSIRQRNCVAEVRYISFQGKWPTIKTVLLVKTFTFCWRSYLLCLHNCSKRVKDFLLTK